MWSMEHQFHRTFGVFCQKRILWSNIFDLKKGKMCVCAGECETTWFSGALSVLMCIINCQEEGVTGSVQNLFANKYFHSIAFLKTRVGGFLGVQWLRNCLPMQGTRDRALVREDPTCRRATKPVRHNYWACSLEPVRHNYWSPCA